MGGFFLGKEKKFPYRKRFYIAVNGFDIWMWTVYVQFFGFSQEDEFLPRSNETVQQLFPDLKKAYGSVWREVSYNIPIEFGIPRNW